MLQADLAKCRVSLKAARAAMLFFRVPLGRFLVGRIIKCASSRGLVVYLPSIKNYRRSDKPSLSIGN